MKRGLHTTSAHRGVTLHLMLYALGLVVLMVAINLLAHRDGWREEFDATRTRAYSLSEQTQRILDDLQGEWEIVLVLARAEFDRSILRQIDEVLERFAEGSPNVSVQTVDPTDPAALDEYERMLDRLRNAYRDEMRAYDRALQTGRAVIEDLMTFAASEASTLRGLARGVPVDHPIASQLRQMIVYLDGLEGWEQVLEQVDRELETSISQPIPRYEHARSTIAAALATAAEQIDAIAAILQSWQNVRGIDPSRRDALVSQAAAFQEMAVRCARASDPLVHLPPLEISRIGEAIAAGQAAVLIGPEAAQVIPSSKLLTTANLRETSAGGVAFDQRFRGEQLIASTIRAVREEIMPMVVFVHAQPQSLLQQREGAVDLFGVTSILDAAQFDVQEWMIGSGDQPVPEEGQAQVFVVVPPPFTSRQSTQPDRAEMALVSTAEGLIDDGHDVLLSFTPSFMHRLEQPDPWQALAEWFGIEADTSRLLIESFVVEGGERASKAEQDVAELRSTHPIAGAVHGLQMRLGFPLPITHESPPEGIEVMPLIEIGSDDNRWLEEDWFPFDQVELEDDDDVLREPMTLAVAVERRLGDQSAQRAILVGSADWMYSRVADQTVALGGRRQALISPGNHEFMQASVAWLAHKDDLIAQSPVSRQVARLDGITENARFRWGLIVIFGLPLLSLTAGFVVWLLRRF